MSYQNKYFELMVLIFAMMQVAQAESFQQPSSMPVEHFSYELFFPLQNLKINHLLLTIFS